MWRKGASPAECTVQRATSRRRQRPLRMRAWPPLAFSYWVLGAGAASLAPSTAFRGAALLKHGLAARGPSPSRGGWDCVNTQVTHHLSYS